jgi:hypothetical protein
LPNETQDRETASIPLCDFGSRKIKLQATSANDLISLRLQPAADSARADIVMYQEYLATNREPKEVTVLQSRP